MIPWSTAEDKTAALCIPQGCVSLVIPGHLHVKNAKDPIQTHSGMSPLPEGTLCLPAWTDRKYPSEPDVNRAGNTNNAEI